MNANQRNRRMIFAGIGIIVLVLLIALVFSNHGGSNSTDTAVAAKSVPVVVAAQSIPEGTTFRVGEPLGAYFVVRQLPADAVPFGAYGSVDQISKLLASNGCAPANVAGCQGQVTTTQAIYQNLPVVSGMFSTLGQYRVTRSHAFDIPYGYVATAVDFTEVNSVLNSIEPGDTIDLMASYLGNSKDLGFTAPAQTQFVLNDLKVIGVGGPPTSPNGTTTSAQATNSGGSLLLLVTFQQALEIQHLKDFGWTLSAVLQSAHETKIPHFRTLPVTDKWFWDKISNKLARQNPY